LIPLSVRQRVGNNVQAVGPDFGIHGAAYCPEAAVMDRNAISDNSGWPWSTSSLLSPSPPVSCRPYVIELDTVFIYTTQDTKATVVYYCSVRCACRPRRRRFFCPVDTIARGPYVIQKWCPPSASSAAEYPHPACEYCRSMSAARAPRRRRNYLSPSDSVARRPHIIYNIIIRRDFVSSSEHPELVVECYRGGNAPGPAAVSSIQLTPSTLDHTSL
jgi:hypothetical protein